MNLNCSQVIVLINSYIEGKLNHILEKAVKNHLSKCKNCKMYADDIKNKLLPVVDTQKQDDIKKNNNIILKNLSAYIDNELSPSETIRVKKMTISNPDTRKNLEKMYKYQKILHYAFEKTKNELKNDYSKSVIAILANTNEDHTGEYLKKIIIISFIIVTIAILFIIHLYF